MGAIILWVAVAVAVLLDQQAVQERQTLAAAAVVVELMEQADTTQVTVVEQEDFQFL
jgi:hypothetical protein